MSLTGLFLKSRYPVYTLYLTHLHLDGLLRRKFLTWDKAHFTFHKHICLLSQLFIQKVNSLCFKMKCNCHPFQWGPTVVERCWQGVNISPPSEGTKPGRPETRSSRSLLVNLYILPKKVPPACPWEINISVGRFSVPNKILWSLLLKAKRSVDTIAHTIRHSSQNFMTT